MLNLLCFLQILQSIFTDKTYMCNKISFMKGGMIQGISAYINSKNEI
jgi:ABC-type enterochelin transport system permease subunit